MKLTKKLETEILKVYNMIVDANLSGDIKTFSYLLDENCQIFGTAASEVFKNKKEAVKFYSATVGQVTGKVEFRNRKIRVMTIENEVMVNERFDFYLLIDDQWTFYGACRVSCLFHKKNNQWKVIHMHGSFPDSRSEEGEQISADKIKAENIRLRDAVRRRTEELEHKNRELEIETALEKVRAVAMGIKQPADMLEICKTISLQLQLLGVAAIRNVQTAIFYEAKGAYMNYEYYAKHKKTFITETSYTNHKIARDFATKMLRGKGQFSITHIKGEKVKDWIAYQKTTNVFIDKYLQTASSLNYYWYSLGPVALGISVYDPLSKENMDLFKRFLKVFELAYRRYLDIEKAQAQAREAQVEVSMEKVRSRSLAMQKPAELIEVAELLRNEMGQLGVEELETSSIYIIGENDSAECWYAIKDVRDEHTKLVSDEMILTLNDTWVGKEMWKFYQSKKLQTSIVMKGENRKEWINYCASRSSVLQGYYGEEIPERTYHLVKFNGGYMGAASSGDISAESRDLLKRAAAVFSLAYTRFKDLQNAEARTREAQIELALERVRARTMAMHKSEELKEVIQLVYDQFVHLNINLDHAGFVVDYKLKGNWNFWIADKQDIPAKITHSYFDSVWANQFNDAKEKGINFFATYLNFKEKNKFYRKLLSYVPGIPEESKKFYLGAPAVAVSTVLMKDVGLYIENFLATPYNDEENNILLRFGKVFQQTYTRFLDLQKAEAQARENQIQLALERARAQSMMMQHSTELDDTLRVFHEQVLQLNIPSAFSFLWLPDEDKDRHIFWAAWAENNSTVFKSKAINYPLDRNEPATAQCLVDWKSSEPVVAYHVPPEGVTNYFAAWSELIAGVEQLKPEYFSEGLYYVEAFMKYGCFGVMVKHTLAEDEKKILERFAIEFERAYTRFLDLQKAEAQTKEGQIQLALERVRARTMAMQHSNELPEAANLLFQQMQTLGMPAWSAGYCIWDDDKNGITLWMSSEGVLQPPFHAPVTEDPSFIHFKEAHNKGQSFHIDEIGGEALVKHYQYMRTLPVVGEILDSIINAGHPLPTFQIFHAAYFSYGFLLFITYEPMPEAHDIFKRFGKVFDQTYTRFLDLQKAEEQARESQVQLALERVRARTMAMQRSEELPEVAALLFQQVKTLGVPQFHCGFNIFEIDDKECIWYPGSADGDILPPCKIPLTEHPVFMAFNESRKRGDELFVYEKEGEYQAGHYRYMLSLPVLGEILQNMLDAGIPFPTFQIDHLVNFSHGNLLFITSEHFPEMHDTFKRFAKVFEQTYTRFLDLQKAEAQAKEAQIETALERVRSRTLAMQRSEELSETASVLFKQLILLGIEPNRLYIGIMHGKNGEIEAWATDEAGGRVSSMFVLNSDKNASVKKMFDAWKNSEKTLVIDMQGKELLEYLHYLGEELHVPITIGLTQKRRVQHIAYFSKGFIGMASPDEQSAETLQLLERFAYVFNLTFTRFSDLKIAEAHALQAEQDLIAIKDAKQKAEEALTELRATQRQLIQSEKMASLGELTAGIAHEIQNPLNFVNNFSEVSNELIAEMNHELIKGDIEEAKAIANDIQQNLEKINHHGKRADAIVKGMLQHSRSSNAVKAPTDINKLADEYLRLAFHGLRAKDKSFNTLLQTDFDETIGTVNIIPQDIGRVLLNLINNAFYAVSEKKKQRPDEYEPAVSIITKRIADKVEIAIRDNGNGISQKVVDKIFQPFFTTKPTGQGTGLGLSLSYDIVKAHAGELKVKTKEGEGSEFIIDLPVR